MGADHVGHHPPLTVRDRRSAIALWMGGLFVATSAWASPPHRVRPDSASGAAACEAHAAASSRHAVRLAVSLDARRLSVLRGGDTLCTMPVVVATSHGFAYGGRRWRFATPTGRRAVRDKRVRPVWIPPDWHYAEVARAHDLTLRVLSSRPIAIAGGRQLVVRNAAVAVINRSGRLSELPVDEHVVFGGTLYIPPVGSRNRRIEDVLGAYALDLGDGILLHGTTAASDVAATTTHGCIRLLAADLQWLFDHVPVGTSVVIR